jgi:CRISPR/Cas system-associated exonuclease Cas4 (RecB family)
MISQLNLLTNLSSVEIKPYSTNQSNNFKVTDREFEIFIQKWITSPIEKKFQFVNEDNIRKSLAGEKNAFSNDHVYITPTGQFAVLEFDLNDREYFKQLDSIEEYIDWAGNEPEKNTSSICKSCKYYGKCLTEHYRYVRDLTHSCNGYKLLLDWYKVR